MRLVPIEPAVQRYAWGSPIAVPALFGWSSDGRPIAELWYGDHARAPALALIGDRPQPLDRVLAADPALGGPLGFLLKILAAEAPLSLQCHPDAAQAARGFADEEARGVPLDAPGRRFADPRAKPELVVALARFEALAGVRPASEIRSTAARLRLAALADRLPADDAAVAGFVAGLLRMEGAQRTAVLAQAAAAARDARHAADAWIGHLLDRYPDDPAALAPLFLHHVVLAAGEALYLEARRLHAYLGGLALELMGPSDNVLRAGLTTKHVDLAALLAVADLGPSRPQRVAPRAEGGVRRYRPAGADLALDELALEGNAVTLPAAAGARVALDLDGEIDVSVGDERVELGRGDALLVAAGTAVELCGRGTLVLVGAG